MVALFFHLQVHLQVQPAICEQTNDNGSLERRVQTSKVSAKIESDWPIAI